MPAKSVNSTDGGDGGVGCDGGGDDGDGGSDGDDDGDYKMIMIRLPHCLWQPRTTDISSPQTGFQPSVQLGDISSFYLMDGENLFFLLAKTARNSSSK